jgi:cell division septal protein FtsQ
MKDSMSGTLKFEAEFFRNSNNLTVAREKKIHSIQVRTIHLLMLLTLTLLAGWAVYKTANYLLTCDALQVHSFRLRNQPVFAREKMDGILRRFGGNILTLDLGDLHAQLLQVPEIADVSIRRVLPDTVEIAFILRRPFYQLYENGLYQLLDAGGVVLGEQPGMTDGLIPLHRGNGMDPAALAALSPELRPLREKIEYVGVGQPYGIELKLKETPEIFFPGETDLAEKIGRYFRIKSRLPMDVSAIRSVDLRIAGRIYLEFQDEQRGNS